MYEAWLALNIAWETLLPAWPALAAGAAAWLALVAVARRHGASWRGGLPAAAGVGLVVAVVAVVALPAATRSSIAEARYWVDWFALAGLGAAAGALAAAVAWPIAALRAR